MLKKKKKQNSQKQKEMCEHTLKIMLKTAKKRERKKKKDTAHIMGADGHFESYAILQSVPLASSLHSSHSLQTKLLSTLLHCGDFVLTRSRSFFTLWRVKLQKLQ